MIARSLFFAGLLVVAGCGSNQTNSLPGGGEEGPGGGGGTGHPGNTSASDAGGDGRAGTGGTCAGCNDPPPPVGDGGQDPPPPANPGYLQICFPGKNPPVAANCTGGLTCVNFDDKGNACTHTCTQPADCASPATGCATSKGSAGQLYCVP